MFKTSQSILIIIVLLFSNLVFCQIRQERDTVQVYKQIIPFDKLKRMKNVDMIANMNFNFRNDFENSNYLESRFRFEQFRMEIKGYVSNRLYFRFRHRFTSLFVPQEIDKVIKGVDLASIRIDLNNKLQLTVGKTFADWGGVEFDLNPIDIYEYSDIIEFADNFLSGVGLYYKINEKHALSFQALNSRTGEFDDIYDTIPNTDPSKAPLAGVINWRGTFLNGKIKTLWSYSLFTEAQNLFKNYFALGQSFNFKKIELAYDFKLSIEQLDRTGVVSTEIPDSLYNYSVKNTLYYSHWLRFTYKVTPQWHLSLDAFIDYAYWLDDLDPIKTENKFRTVYSFIPTVEYYPLKNVDIKFFLGYVGRYYQYSDYAKNRAGLLKQNFNTGRIIIGFISPLKFF